MTAPPLPASPCLRVRLIYTDESDNDLGGNRFYLAYASAAPSAGNCSTIAADIATAWNSNLAEMVNQNWSLTEIDVLDIATDSGASGQWTGVHAGTRSGANLPAQCATNVEFDIARRYRGGKPRMYLPPGITTDQADAGHYNGTFITDMNTQFAAFMTAVEAISVGSVGALTHVNLSYYKGFTNVTNSSGRERAVPTYRATALVDPINGYATKGVIGSQRRRRTATTA